MRERVEDDLTRGLAVAAHDREHRHAGRRVRVLDHQRERPEVRRRPQEHDEEEPERRKRERSGRRRVADERRHRPGGAADDDVLRRRALEPAGVDEDVEEVPDEREYGRQHVDRGGEERERERREQDPELERLLRRHAAGRDRALLRAAAHEHVDVAVEHVVERGRSAAGEREADHRDREEPERRHALRADEHPGGAGEEEERHDPRLRQREVVARGGERRRFAAQRANDDDEREAERDGRTAHVQRDRPGRVPAPGDDAAERDRDEERDERGSSRRAAAPDTRAARARRFATSKRQRDEGDRPVRRSRARARR